MMCKRPRLKTESNKFVLGVPISRIEDISWHNRHIAISKLPLLKAMLDHLFNHWRRWTAIVNDNAMLPGIIFCQLMWWMAMILQLNAVPSCFVTGE
ncbi:hypothetical protein A4S05_14650 [Nostoc sp. KVJ20]|nr:hypothetical protein A4S05_14650 [Nostoc sp. KVJ20]